MVAGAGKGNFQLPDTAAAVSPFIFSYRPNMNGTNEKQRQIQDCFSPGGGSAVKAVTKVEHQHRVPLLRGQGGV